MSYDEDEEFGAGAYGDYDDGDEPLNLPDEIADLEEDSDDPEDRYH